ncbi:MAG: SRPBCC domain-containing protein [Saprospiraceae bacterium]|nr:SRPBCC domain-containing protein [Saprospiraceae bacterium]
MLISLPLGLVFGQDGKAKTVKKTFNRTTEVSIDIAAGPQTIWDLLTDAENFASWNSTVVSLKGNIQLGEKIELVSTLDPERTFKLKIKEMAPSQRLVWGDFLGKRTYQLTKNINGTTFYMHEKIGGFMFPLFAKKIPSFDESFEAFARDLKKAAVQK